VPDSPLKTINIKEGMPPVRTALSRLADELAAARAQGYALLKIIHGYGSTGIGGEIRAAVQTRLIELKKQGQIQDCIVGEDWRKSEERSWKLLGSYSALKQDHDLGKANRGITIVVL
jgi:hypothetical protein